MVIRKYQVTTTAPNGTHQVGSVLAENKRDAAERAMPLSHYDRQEMRETRSVRVQLDAAIRGHWTATVSRDGMRTARYIGPAW